jgi:hypothetical protein
MNGMTDPKAAGQDTMQSEPGGQDNRLILDPSMKEWSDTIGSWKDGETYDMTITGPEGTMTAKARQISPGNFEITPGEPEGAQESGDAPAEESAEGGTPSAGGSQYPNPAVAGMMEKP